MKKTIEHLKSRRKELVDQRHREAFLMNSPFDFDAIQRLTTLHIAILAFDAVIEQEKALPTAHAM